MSIFIFCCVPFGPTQPKRQRYENLPHLFAHHLAISSSQPKWLSGYIYYYRVCTFNSKHNNKWKLANRSSRFGFIDLNHRQTQLKPNPISTGFFCLSRFVFQSFVLKLALIFQAKENLKAHVSWAPCSPRLPPVFFPFIIRPRRARWSEYITSHISKGPCVFSEDASHAALNASWRQRTLLILFLNRLCCCFLSQRVHAQLGWN